VRERESDEGSVRSRAASEAKSKAENAVDAGPSGEGAHVVDEAFIRRLKTLASNPELCRGRRSRADRVGDEEERLSLLPPTRCSAPAAHLYAQPWLSQHSHHSSDCAQTGTLAALVLHLPPPRPASRSGSRSPPAAARLTPAHAHRFANYSVAFSPFYPNKLALAGAANFGLVGNGRLSIVTQDAPPPAGLAHEKVYVHLSLTAPRAGLWAGNSELTQVHVGGRLARAGLTRRTACTTSPGPSATRTKSLRAVGMAASSCGTSWSRCVGSSSIFLSACSSTRSNAERMLILLGAPAGRILVRADVHVPPAGLSGAEMARAPARGLLGRLEQRPEGALLHEQLGWHDQDCASLSLSPVRRSSPRASAS